MTIVTIIASYSLLLGSWSLPHQNTIIAIIIHFKWSVQYKGQRLCQVSLIRFHDDYRLGILLSILVGINSQRLIVATDWSVSIATSLL